MFCRPAKGQFIGEITAVSPVVGGTYQNYEVKEKDANATYGVGNSYSLGLTDRAAGVSGQSGAFARVVVVYNFAEEAGNDGLSVGDTVVVSIFSSQVSTREPLYIIERVIDTTGGKSAIEMLAGEYRALFCVEAPEQRYEDIMRIELAGTYTEALADGLYMQSVVLNTIEVVGLSCNRLPPGPVAARWENPHVVVECGHAPPEPILVTVRLSGLARGAEGRFPIRSEEEFSLNRRRWRYMNGLG